MTLHAALGVASGILSLVPCPLYVRAILRGDTKPNRVTWWALAVVSALIAGSSYQVGARDTLWLPLAYTGSFTVVALLSLRFGDGKKGLGRLDQGCLVAAGLCAFVWWRFKAPEISLVGSVATEFAGLVPTIAKAFKRPHTEDRSAWIVATFASVLNLGALGAWTPVLALYPLYVFTTNLAVTALLLRPRSAARPVEADAP